MSAIAAATVVTAGIGAYSSNNASNKAIQAQKDAAKAAQIDIDALNAQTKAISTQNAIDSANLERQLTPEVPQIRTAANQAILGGIGQTQNESQSISMLQQALASGSSSPLLQDAIAKARSNLALGGKLDAETQNAVTRSGIANAAGVAGARGGMGLGRDVVARDLGLTSLQLENQRLAQALQGGAQEQGMNLSNAQIQQSRINQMQQLSQSPYARAMMAGQYGESIRQPNVGLDPSSIANLKIGNSNANAAALANQGNIAGRQSQNYGQLAGNAFGAMMQYNQGGGVNPYAPAPSSQAPMITTYTPPGGTNNLGLSGWPTGKLNY